MSEKVLLVGFGNPLLDIIAEVTEEFLKTHGLDAHNAAEQADEDHVNLANEFYIQDGVKYIPGGSAQNIVRCAKWMLGDVGATAIVGSVGGDEYGKTMRDKNTSSGVKSCFYEDATQPSGRCCVGTLEKNRTCVTRLCAAANYPSSHFDSAEVQAALKSSTVVFVSAFFYQSNKAVAEKVLAHCLENGKFCCMNLGSNSVAKFIGENFTDNQWNAVNMFVAHSSEAKNLCDAMNMGLGERDFKMMAKKISQTKCYDVEKPRLVVITDHENPITSAYGPEVDEHVVMPVPVSEIADTNGVGDAFLGGYLAEMIRQVHDQDSIPAAEVSKKIFSGANADSEVSFAMCLAKAKEASNVILRVKGCDVPQNDE